jgi:hypothetical protein
VANRDEPTGDSKLHDHQERGAETPPPDAPQPPNSSVPQPSPWQGPPLSAETQRRHAERAVVRARYRGIFNEARDLFDEVDPVGISFGDNSGEYDLEVGTILPRLETATSLDDAVRIVEEEFERWFDSSYTVEPLAKLLWPMWLRWKAMREAG